MPADILKLQVAYPSTVGMAIRADGSAVASNSCTTYRCALAREVRRQTVAHCLGCDHILHETLLMD
ncbi:hypothetical protein C6P88_13255 [Burkholderia contaminans]|nr:hypothetical protein C6P88_13255 [Burkholderia contaminans]